MTGASLGKGKRKPKPHAGLYLFYAFAHAPRIILKAICTPKEGYFKKSDLVQRLDFLHFTPKKPHFDGKNAYSAQMRVILANCEKHLPLK